jgi:hypothetical protein
MLYLCVYLHLYATCYAWQYENTISCDVATFYVLFLFDFVNLNSGNVFLCTFFFLFGMECFFFAIHLYLFCNHTRDKIAITHMCCFCNCVFFLQSQHISGQGCLQSPCIFHEVATTSSKDQTSHTKLFYQFLQSQSHCYKGCNHTET